MMLQRPSSLLALLLLSLTLLSSPPAALVLHMRMNAASRVVSLFTNPGQGQSSLEGRSALHASNARRSPLDPLMLPSHAGFGIGTVLSLYNGLFDLAALTAATTLLSLLYHASYEAPGRLCAAESVSAKLLFAYGAAQLLRAAALPRHFLLVETACLVVTAGVFLYTNLRRESYDRWHWLLHAVPSVWVAVVATGHSPLFALAI